MEVFIRNLVLCLLSGISCKLFFGMLLPERRKWGIWADYTEIPVFTAGFMLIAVTPIPPYFLQPVRVIAVLFLISCLYYRTGIVRNLLAALLFCGIYWLISVALYSVIWALPLPGSRAVYDAVETVVEWILLCLMMTLHTMFRKRAHALAGLRWERFGFFPLLVMVVLTSAGAISWEEGTEGNYAQLIFVTGLVILCVSILYFAVWRLEKEEELRWLQLSGERAKNQMEMYRSMQKNYEEQRRILHDYSNQLQCIQGMLKKGETEETLRYVTGLTGSLKENTDYVNTNHTVVNVVLNRKYQDAQEKGIVMALLINDLSGLTISEEDLVILLVNLLDNAIEACEKLAENRVIQFKMVMEEKELVLSVRNPVKEAVRIRDRRIATGKSDKSRHGIGLSNVDTVIRKYDGTSVLKCDNGWFYFAAMIPCPGSDR